MAGASRTDSQAPRVVEIYTDGACSGNPGPGGWGALLTYGGRTRELCGGEATPTTNNRMELMAAIQALESLTRRSIVHLHTDSSYLRNGIMSWLPGWKRNGWRTASKQPVKNEDLWRRLDAAARAGLDVHAADRRPRALRRQAAGPQPGRRRRLRIGDRPQSSA